MKQERKNPTPLGVGEVKNILTSFFLQFMIFKMDFIIGGKQIWRQILDSSD